MIVNLTRQSTVAAVVRVADNPSARMKGLLGCKELPQGHALIITQCRSVHMFFMKFAIDVIFCNGRHEVVGLCPELKPFGLSPIFVKASYAVELPAGSITASATQIGDQLQIGDRHF